VFADRFYQDAGDKIKINWFCYEYANTIFLEIKRSPALEAYRNSHSKKEIVDFCVYYAKRIRKSIFDAQLGLMDGVWARDSYIYEFYGIISETLADGLLNAASQAYDVQTTSCFGCPSRCLQEGFERTAFFDIQIEDDKRLMSELRRDSVRRKARKRK